MKLEKRFLVVFNVMQDTYEDSYLGTIPLGVFVKKPSRENLTELYEFGKKNELTRLKEFGNKFDLVENITENELEFNIIEGYRVMTFSISVKEEIVAVD